MIIRKSLYLGMTALFFIAVFLLVRMDHGVQASQARVNRQASIDLVKELGLTDLAIFTEASYTRHLSQADRHTVFQNYPSALDHFPSGSLALPPGHLRP